MGIVYYKPPEKVKSFRGFQAGFRKRAYTASGKKGRDPGIRDGSALPPSPPAGELPEADRPLPADAPPGGGAGQCCPQYPAGHRPASPSLPGRRLWGRGEGRRRQRHWQPAPPPPSAFPASLRPGGRRARTAAAFWPGKGEKMKMRGRRPPHRCFLMVLMAPFSRRLTWAWEMPTSALTSIWVLPS